MNTGLNRKRSTEDRTRQHSWRRGRNVTGQGIETEVKLTDQVGGAIEEVKTVQTRNGGHKLPRLALWSADDTIWIRWVGSHPG